LPDQEFLISYEVQTDGKTGVVRLGRPRWSRLYLSG